MRGVGKPSIKAIIIEPIGASCLVTVQREFGPDCIDSTRSIFTNRESLISEIEKLIGLEK